MDKTYRTVKIPGVLIEAIERFLKTGNLGYRTSSEFVIEAVRRRLEELGISRK